MKRVYYGVEILYSQENYDEIYNLLYTEGINSILEENGIIKFYLKEKQLPLLSELKKELLKLRSLSQNDMSVERLQYHNWNREWEKSIEPVYIKDRIIVYPSWKKNELIRSKGQILIEIDPKMSFGTGHNETTQMMLEMLCDYVTKKDISLLDYGCGTAVLAIAGIKLGINKAVAIDIDDDSVMNAQEYINRNKVSKFIKLRKSNIDGVKESSFDIITANIDRKVILNSIETIYSKLKTEGKLFITGILAEEEKEILRGLKRYHFKVIEIRRRAEWLAFYAIKLSVISAKAGIRYAK